MLKSNTPGHNNFWLKGFAPCVDTSDKACSDQLNDTSSLARIHVCMCFSVQSACLRIYCNNHSCGPTQSSCYGLPPNVWCQDESSFPNNQATTMHPQLMSSWHWHSICDFVCLSVSVCHSYYRTSVVVRSHQFPLPHTSKCPPITHASLWKLTLLYLLCLHPLHSSVCSAVSLVPLIFLQPR